MRSNRRDGMMVALRDGESAADGVCIVTRISGVGVGANRDGEYDHSHGSNERTIEREHAFGHKPNTKHGKRQENMQTQIDDTVNVVGLLVVNEERKISGDGKNRRVHKKDE